MDEKLELLPPSSFTETGRGDGWGRGDAWQALSDVTKELLALKEEHKTLLKVHNESSHQSKSEAPPPPPAVHMLQYPPYHDGIMQRQASEIESLKSMLRDKETEWGRRLGAVEAQMTENERSADKQKHELLTELNACQHRLLEQEKALQEKEAVHTSVVRDLSEQSERESVRHREELGEQQREAARCLEQLRQHLQLTQADKLKTETELQHKLWAVEGELAGVREEGEKMRRYLQEGEGLTQSTRALQQDNLNLTNKLKLLEEEKRHLESTVDLLQIRLKSQQEIQTLQEGQLSQLPGVKADKQHKALLTKWREKVYELLVKLRCSELVYVDEVRKLKNELQSAKNDAETMRVEEKRLQLELDDRQAQLDIQTQTNARLLGDVSHAQQVALSLDDAAQQDRQLMRSLGAAVDSSWNSYLSVEKRLSAALNKLNRFSHRVDFACGRLYMLSGQFARREALHKLTSVDEDKCTVTSYEDTPQRDSDIVGQLEVELGQVRGERDSLAAQMRKDAELMQEKITQATLAVSEELERVKQHLLNVHEENEQKSKEAAEEINRLEQENSELSAKVQGLTDQLAECAAETERQVCEESERTRQQLSEMQARLDHARREHTKAVVLVRQTERQHARDKEKHSQQLAEVEEERRRVEERLEGKLRAQQQTCALFTATLQQEGLLERVKAARGAAVQLSDSEEEQLDGCEQRVTDDIHDVTPQSNTMTSTGQDSLHSVIDELRILTEAVSCDESSEEETHHDVTDDVVSDVNSDVTS